MFSFFDRESRIRFSKEYTDWTYKVLTVESQKINSRYDTDQVWVLIHWQNFTVLDRTTNQGYRWFTLESSSPQQSTVLTDKVWSPKRPIQFFQPISSSNFPNSLVEFWFLKLWVICNPNILILKINAAQFVYVKSCYNFFTSEYKKSNCHINIFNISDLRFDVICF